MNGLRVLVGILFGLILTRALAQFGAAETHNLYRFFLFLLVPAGLAMLAWGGRLFSKPTYWPVAAAGAVLIGAVLYLPTTEGRGYVLLAAGWLALLLTLLLGIDRPQTLRRIFFFLIFLGACQAVYGLVQSLGGVDYIGGYYRRSGRLATGTLINRNHYAGLLNLVIPLSLGGLFAAFRARRRREREQSELLGWAWIILLCTAFMGLAMFLSHSRGGVLALLSTLLFLAALLSLNRRRRPGGDLPGAAAWTLLFTIFGLACWVGIGAFLERFELWSSDAGFRGEVYRDTLGLIRDNFLAGVGPGMYQWRFRPYQSVDHKYWFDYAHNDYLQSAAEWGVPAALFFWGLVLWSLLRAARIFLSSREAWMQGMALGCAGAIFSILLHSLVDFTLQIPGIFALFCMILGISWLVGEGPAVPRPGRSPKGVAT